MDGEDCYVLLPPPSGLTKFRSTVVKRYLEPDHVGNQDESRSGHRIYRASTSVLTQPMDLKGARAMTADIGKTASDGPFPASIVSVEEETENYAIHDIDIFKKQGIPQSTNHSKYAHSQTKELNGLLERSVFTPVHIDVAKGHRIFGSRFADQVKHEGTPNEFEKSRLVVEGFNNKSGVLI